MGEARSVVEKFFELFAAGRIDDAGELFDPSCMTLMPGGELDHAAHQAMSHAFKTGLPDARMEIDHVVECGTEIVVLGHFRGTHTGDLQSPGGVLPASGNVLNLRFMDYFDVDDGRIMDHQTVFDQVEMLRQLGALPS